MLIYLADLSKYGVPAGLTPTVGRPLAYSNRSHDSRRVREEAVVCRVSTEQPPSDVYKIQRGGLSRDSVYRWRWSVGDAVQTES